MTENEDFDDLTPDERAVLASVDTMLADPETWSVPSASVERSILHAIATSPNGRVAAAPPASISEPGASTVIRPRRWQPLALSALVGAAAAAVAVLALRSDDTSRSSVASPPVDATVELRGTELAPGVSGSVSATAFPSGVRLNLAVPGLPRRDGGQFYQLWVKNCAGDELIPAGSFHDATDAAGWIGVPLEKYPIITLTREEAAGPTAQAQASSGDVVVSGRLAQCP